MSKLTLIHFLAGAVACAYAIAGGYFLRFWARTRDGLFLSFSWAFFLLALNQALVTLVGDLDERVGYAYVLRVVGFLLILAAIVQKNVARRPRP